MKVIRPIALTDLPALVHLAESAGAGFTSLPTNEKFLREKIELSEHSFSKAVSVAGHERYLFVMEDTDSGEIGACCAIEAACGLDEAFYNYRVGLTVHASRELRIYNQVPTLYLSNDYTGTSVLCSLYMQPHFRGAGAGKLLSKCRFLFMAQFPDRFADKVIAEMRGVSNEDGRSPFWEGLGRHFMSVEYTEAEHIVGMGNKAFIAELMPPHPIYAVLLPREAQEVMGKVHAQTAPALHLLQQEGFRYQGYIDIFDGGPTVEAPREEIRSIKRSRAFKVVIAETPGGGVPCLVANTSLQGFRCIYVEQLYVEDKKVALPAAAAAALKVQEDDTVQVTAL
jgi:arginine N-succinyltransferase